MLIFPMAGLSNRFAEAGYNLPKYMLEAGGRSLFRHAVEGFREYFDRLQFLFIYRDVRGTADFVAAECKAMGVRDALTVMLKAPTRGQAETVYLGLEGAAIEADSPITIFNIDTFRPNFRFPDNPDISSADGYLEVFLGEGANWSFVRAATPRSTRVIETTEKRPISDLCCTGLYHFKRADLFRDAFRAAVSGTEVDAGEYYVAPLYNRLIDAGRDIRYQLIDKSEVIFGGVPGEYEAFRARMETSAGHLPGQEIKADGTWPKS